MSVAGEVADPVAAPPPKPLRKKRNKKVMMLVAVLAFAVSGTGAFFVVKKMTAPPPPPPAPAVKAPVATPPVPVAVVPPATTDGPTPSDTLNSAAKVPINAVNKAQDAIAARKAGGQTTDVDALSGEDVANKAAAPATTKAGTPATKGTTSTSLAPGVSATTDVDAAPEASAAFRAFVTNAKVTSVRPAAGVGSSMYINGRFTRQGEIVDEGLEIVFEGVEIEKRQLIFKDKSGATVNRRY